MQLHLYNTLIRKKELFEPIDPDRVRMYVCGPTVYGDIHIGNARPLVVFDVLYRLLRHIYGADHVTYVRNITDVDDKINARAQELGENISALTARTAAQFHKDAAALGCLMPDEEPRATAHIPEMLAMIQRLLDRSHAYEADGHVLFHVPSMPDYGQLSRRNRDELIAGARVEVAPYKRDPTDFVLWKPSPPELPGWDSPWGRGRPGWHLECSAMSEKHLGTEFDIHGGGLDLIFPHHENEIAQSLCANPGTRFARYWVHNGFLQAEGEKMSKSLGNFYTVRDLLATSEGEPLRVTLMRTHYRQPLDFTKGGLRDATASLDRFYGALESENFEEVCSAQVEPDASFQAALEDDLNTPAALNRLHEMASKIFVASESEALDMRRVLRRSGAMLGLIQRDPIEWKHNRRSGPVVIEVPTDDLSITSHAPSVQTGHIPSTEIEERIEARRKARARKDFAESDRIRDELKDEGIILEDRPDGTTEWRRA